MFDRIALAIIKQFYAFAIALFLAAVTSMLGIW